MWVEFAWSMFRFSTKDTRLTRVDVIEHIQHNINPFLANVPIWYPLKTPENQSSGISRGYKMQTLAKNRLRILVNVEQVIVSCQACFTNQFDNLVQSQKKHKK